MTKKENLLFKWRKFISIVLIITIICGIVKYQTASAQTEKSDYILKDAEVILDGTNDGEAEVKFVTKSGGSFSAVQGVWSISENGDTNYATLNTLTPAVSTNIHTNDTTNGNVLYADITGTGFELEAEGAIWTAKYKIDKDTPEGTYSVNFVANGIDNSNNDYDIDGNEVYTANITVTRNSPSIPLVATFGGDSGVDSIDIYYQKTCSGDPDELDVENTYVRNGDTGEVDVSGNGQVNFKINLKKDYAVTSVTVTEGTYSGTVLGPGDTGHDGVYSVTGISTNAVIAIVTEQKTEYIGTFSLGEGVNGVYIYNTHSYDTQSTYTSDRATVRNGETGETTMDGTGEISFRVEPTNGYYVAPEDIVVTGNYGAIRTPAQTGYTNVYCITNIAGDITIQISARSKLAVIPIITGCEESYAYTGSQIKPSVTVSSEEYSSVLVEGTDYSVTYGENINVAQGGTISIAPLGTSRYQFTERVINFNITAISIQNSDVSVQNSITYRDGASLYPSVSVTVGGVELSEDVDYTVTLNNQTADIGEYVQVVVNGKGNYSGSVTKNVLVVEKPRQVLSFSGGDVNKLYGDDDFTKVVTRTEGNGHIEYSSTNEMVATVDSNTGTVTICGVGSTNIVATARGTEAYAETAAQYTLNVAKRPISVGAVRVKNKVYDGTTNATVDDLNIDYGENWSKVELQEENDYAINLSFVDPNVGRNKIVLFDIHLVGSANDKFVLTNNFREVYADITGVTIEASDITLSPNSYTYDGNAKEPQVSVVINDRTLVLNTDYTVQYRNNRNAGTAYVDVEGIGNYAGSVPVQFTINKTSEVPTVSEIGEYTYTGDNIEPEITVSIGNSTLSNGTDYTVQYSNNKNVGEGAIDISAVSTGNYNFAPIHKTFNIVPYALKDTDVTLSYTTIRWNGEERKPTVTVSANNKSVDSSNYEVEYSNNIAAGEATVTVTAKNGTNYTGTVSKSFTISEKEVLTISGVTNNQTIAYTGNPVVLAGNVSVSENTNGISAGNLSIKYYSNEGNEIGKPTNVGRYSVVYSYSDEDYDGSLTINFEITKAKSDTPAEATQEIKAVAGQTLKDINLSTVGLAWQDENVEITKGSHKYNAVYTKNGDTNCYTTETVSITIYGKSYVNVITSVNGINGTISESLINVLEGTNQTIRFTPDEGYEIESVKVDGQNTAVNNNELTITVGSDNMNVVVKYKAIKYKITMSTTNMDELQSEIVDIDYKSNKEIKLKAKFGYKLTSVKVNGKEMINSIEDDMLSLENITSDINIVATAERITYNYSKGSKQTYTVGEDEGEGVTFVIDADFSLFANRVYIDGTLIDKSYYTAKSGSTILTFTNDFMNNLLQTGTNTSHTITVAFNDGGEATTTFTVSNPKIEDDNKNNKNETVTTQNSNGVDNNNNDNSNNKVSKENSNKSTKTGDNIWMYFVLIGASIIAMVIIKKLIMVKHSKAGKGNKKH